MVTVEIRTVDGGFRKYEENDKFFSKLQVLQSQGYTGKELIHALISDDWGPPPSIVVIKWSKNGQNFATNIPYE